MWVMRRFGALKISINSDKNLSKLTYEPSVGEVTILMDQELYSSKSVSDYY